jgi:hypothetical protein
MTIRSTPGVGPTLGARLRAFALELSRYQDTYEAECALIEEAIAALAVPPEGVRPQEPHVEALFDDVELKTMADNNERVQMQPKTVMAYRPVATIVRATPRISHEAAEGAQGWRDISMAPNDKAVLVYYDGQMMTAMHSYSPAMQGWWAWGSRQIYPTHWMPLPDPPAREETT